uniref:Proliferation-associated protein 2G4-like isoform X1 n=2 Tax=Saccoglossus kowalevskii TaxID=10224 RepID=A0ABM0GP93_SACKO|nr:PREDICTED: proliferation-associated protein 2G4-like isoform X1 [Saccoglossus kowalevskii]
MADSGDEEPTISSDIVVTKYKMVGEIVNRIVRKLVEKAKDGESSLGLCEFGDTMILEETTKVYKKEKEMKKGIAFPTCVSINNGVCHFSPLKSDPDVLLKDGDVVKIDLGAHIDGFIAVVAHTFVVGASKDNKVSGRKADVIVAAHQAAEAALRLVKPGNENSLVTDTIQKVAEAYNCQPVEGMLSHQLKRNVIDGEKSIIQHPNEAQRKEHDKCDFDVHEVYAIDMLVSTGEGKAREKDARTTVFKRKDAIYQLKMKASRMFFSEMERRFNLMPFTLRAFEDEKKARMGVVECVKHGLVDPFPVLYEKDGEFVAQFKFTVLLMPNGPQKITDGPFDPEIYDTEYKIEDSQLKTLLTASANPKTAKKKKKKAATKAKEAASDAATEPAGGAEGGRK